MKVKNHKEHEELFNKDFTGITEVSDGAEKIYWVCMHYYQNGELHRKDGPACEFADGRRYWYLNGKRFVFEEKKMEEFLK
jgi:hypothetical protein